VPARVLRKKPLWSFGVFSVTRLGFSRAPGINTRLHSRTAGELESALRQLKREGAASAILAGDMTDSTRRSQFEHIARVVRRAGLPVYGCLGDNDTVRDPGDAIADTIPKLFPSGPQNTDYVFTRPPLRFIVLDGSYWRGKATYRDGMPDWLRETLAADTATPTIVVSHHPFYLRGGESTGGYDLGKQPWLDRNLMVTLDAAPNVVATMNGHLYYNAAATYHGITNLQNPAFVEWPNAYRVCRVYAQCCLISGKIANEYKLDANNLICYK
jgi:hypothetical protein